MIDHGIYMCIRYCFTLEWLLQHQNCIHCHPLLLHHIPESHLHLENHHGPQHTCLFGGHLQQLYKVHIVHIIRKTWQNVKTTDFHNIYSVLTVVHCKCCESKNFTRFFDLHKAIIMFHTQLML